jgi:hypothetical protein
MPLKHRGSRGRGSVGQRAIERIPFRAVTVALLSVALSGCDNINWGGAEIAVVPPPKVSAAPATSGEEVEERLPQGPVLYYVTRSGNSATMVPVGEISGDTMLPIRALKDLRAFSDRYIAEQLRQGAEFVLYRQGSRVGTLVVQSATAPQPNACPALPRAQGALELSAGTDGITEFLAIAEQYAPEIRRRADRDSLAVPGTMRLQAPYIAERIIRARHAQLPGNWQRAMEQLQPIPVSGAADLGFAATFLVGDTLGYGMDNEGYSVFFIGVPAPPTTYDTAFVQFSNYPETGKVAPRVIDFLDWNRDDQAEVLLQVFGINDSWFETVGRKQNGQWARTFRARCEQTAPPQTTPDTMSRDTALK